MRNLPGLIRDVEARHVGLGPYDPSYWVGTNCETMWCGMAAQGNHVDGTVRAGLKPAPTIAPSQLTTRARDTNDKPTHLSIAPNAVRLIPFHCIVITDGIVGAGFKPARITAAPVVARIIAAPVATRTIAAFGIGS